MEQAPTASRAATLQGECCWLGAEAGSSTGASMLRQGGAHAPLAASHRFCGSRWGVWACGKARARARSEVCLLAALPRGQGRHPARPSPWTPHPGSGRTNELSGIGRCSQTARAGERQRAGADGSQRGAHLLPAPAVRGAAAGTPVRHAPLLHAQTAPKACLRATGLTVVGMRCLPRFWAAGASICTRGRCRRQPPDVGGGSGGQEARPRHSLPRDLQRAAVVWGQSCSHSCKRQDGEQERGHSAAARRVNDAALALESRAQALAAALRQFAARGGGHLMPV